MLHAKKIAKLKPPAGVVAEHTHRAHHSASTGGNAPRPRRHVATRHGQDGIPGRHWRGRALLVLGFAAVLLVASGCGAAAKIDPGTLRGTYNILVTATAGQSTATTTLAITVQ